MTTSTRTYRQPLLPPEYQAAATTRPVPLLPPEIWAKIAAELLLLDEPIWVAWKRYRTVSPVFKKAIEDSYLAHVVSGARIYVDYGPYLPIPPPVHSYYGEYWFDGFDDKAERLAVLRLNEDRCTFHRSRRARDLEFSSSSRREWLDWFEQQIEGLREPGYNYCLIMSLGIRERVGQGFSDMLPIDLKYASEAGSRKFVFDWRTHLSNVFNHMDDIEFYEMGHYAHHVPELASRLYRAGVEADPPHHEVDFYHHHDIMKKLMDAANTTKVGLDGRLLPVREQMRQRFGCMTGHFVRLAGGYGPRQFLHEQRFATQDSRHVAQKLLLYQEAAAMEGKLWKL